MKSLLADLFAALHLGVVVFMVLGFLGICVGVLRGWRWIRNPWFRFGHLGIMAYVVLTALRGELCFLTHWETALRRTANGGGESISFVGRLLREALYVDLDPFWLNAIYYVVGGLLALSLVLAPPRWPGRGRRSTGDQ